jgi:hypothetical protein
VRYRKLPVEVDAIQFTGENYVDIIGFIGDNGGFQWDGTADPTRHAVWDYLHDTWVTVNDGDWIIKGVKGEHYPCNPDVFATTYEEAA